jgi:sugar transferase (PEP-CTERM/EpsH1 system associated)
MRILILWHEFPSPYWGATLPMFNLLRRFSEKHEMTLVCFRRIAPETTWKDPNLSQYCEKIITVDLKLPRNPSMRAIILALKNMTIHIASGKTNPILASPFYTSKMAKELDTIQKLKSYDVILTNGQMTVYVKDAPFPKIVVPFDARSENHLLMYKNSKRYSQKLLWLLLHVREKLYESDIYDKFDACVVVTERDRALLQHNLKNARIAVIPNGVDIEYFKPKGDKRESMSMVFVGSMSQQPNITGVLRFCKEILPLVRKEAPESKLYIIGSNPSKEILELASGDSIIVTGFVDDVRPYLEKASVVIAPMFYGVGIKNKILEAMAMGKPIVTTSNGIEGIDAVPGKDILVADAPEDFAKHVLTVLKSEPYGDCIGRDARRLIEEKYSWSRTAEKYNLLIQETTLAKQRTTS